MVSLFGLWIEKRARLAGSGPALPQKGGATAGNARTYAAAKASDVCLGCAARMLQVHDFCTHADGILRNGKTADNLCWHRRGHTSLLRPLPRRRAGKK